MVSEQSKRRGRLLRISRKRHGLLQREVEEHFGLAGHRITRYERGVMEIPEVLWQRLAQYFPELEEAEKDEKKRPGLLRKTGSATESV